MHLVLVLVLVLAPSTAATLTAAPAAAGAQGIAHEAVLAVVPVAMGMEDTTTAEAGEALIRLRVPLLHMQEAAATAESLCLLPVMVPVYPTPARTR